MVTTMTREMSIQVSVFWDTILQLLEILLMNIHSYPIVINLIDSISRFVFVGSLTTRKRQNY